MLLLLLLMLMLLLLLLLLSLLVTRLLLLLTMVVLVTLLLLTLLLSKLLMSVLVFLFYLMLFCWLLMLYSKSRLSIQIRREKYFKVQSDSVMTITALTNSSLKWTKICEYFGTKRLLYYINPHGYNDATVITMSRL